MIERAITFLKKVYEWIGSDVVKDYVKDLIKHEITKGVMYVLVTFGLGWFATSHVDAVHKALLTDEEKTAVQDNKKLTAQLQVSHTVQSLDPNVLKEAVKQALSEMPKQFDQRAFQQRMDSMARVNKQLVEIVTNFIDVNHTETSKVTQSKFEGDFVSGIIYHNFKTGNDDSVKTNLHVKLGQISTRYEARNGQLAQITSYWMQSTTNPSAVQFLDSVVATITEKTIPPEDVRRFFLNPSLNADVAFMPTSASLSYSFWCVSSAGDIPKNIWLKLPEMGISTDFKTSLVAFIGIRFGVSHFLPVIQDLYISPRYGVDFRENKLKPMIAIGTTL